MPLPESDLAQLAYLLRLTAMTGREIAAVRPGDRDEILELVDRAEEVGRRLDEIARREMTDPPPAQAFARVIADRKH